MFQMHLRTLIIIIIIIIIITYITQKAIIYIKSQIIHILIHQISDMFRRQIATYRETVQSKIELIRLSYTKHNNIWHRDLIFGSKTSILDVCMHVTTFNTNSGTKMNLL